jgi:flavin-dependent dehydrogenase
MTAPAATPTLVIGGGLAGGAAAARLASLGRKVLLVEREIGPHDKVCGEFLSVEAARHLAALGLDVTRLAPSRIGRMRLWSGSRKVETALPFAALGLSRRRLDAALSHHAQGLGAEIVTGVTVRGARADGAETSQGPVAAGQVLVATGKHDLRGARRAGPGVIADLIGFKQYFRPSPALAARLDGMIEVTAFSGGYAGLQLVEGGVANLCLLTGKPRYDAAGGDWPGLFKTLLQEPGLAALADAEPLRGKPLAIAGVPYGYVRDGSGDGVFRLGDQAAVIPSFCGDGMAIALHSGRLAADAVAEGVEAAVYQARLAADVGAQVRLATRVQRFATGSLGRFALMAGLGAAPAALRLLARMTRVTPEALARAGV